MMARGLSRFPIGSAMALLLLPMPVFAQTAKQFGLTVSLGAEYSDNVGRTNANEESDTALDAGLVLSYSRDRGALLAAIATDLRYRTYLDGRFDDELLGGASVRLSYELIPDRVDWVLEDEFGKSFIDPRRVESPLNRQNVNSITTGPDIRIPLGAITSIVSELRATQVWYEESDFGSVQYSAAAGLSRQLTETNSLAAIVQEDRFEYDDLPQDADFKIRSAYLRFEGSGSRTRLTAKGGATRLDMSGDESSGALVDVSLTRTITTRSKLVFNAGTDLTDATGAFRRGRSGVDLAADDTFRTISADPLRSNFAIASWSYAGASRSLDVALQWRREEHERNVELDRDRIGADLTLTRRLKPSLSGSVYASYFEDDFESLDSGFDEWALGFGFDWKMARGYSVALRAEHRDGAADLAPNSPTLGKFVENRVSLRLSYTPGS